jgi:hypothetical protein
VGKTQEEIIANAEQAQRDGMWKTPKHALISHLGSTYGVETHEHARKILKLGRELHPLEVKALRLRDEVQGNDKISIDIVIHELE